MQNSGTLCPTPPMPQPNALAHPFFHTPEQRVALARERFFEDGERPRGLVSDAVIGSWERSMRLGLAPQQRPEFEPVLHSRVRRAQERSRALLQAAAPECEQLQATLAGTQCKALLTDQDGVVVHATRSASAAGTLLDTASRVGVFLGEANFGCTAPGIATCTAEACSVAGGEHFFGMLQTMHCAAAPVRDRSGRLAGVLDLSIEGRPFGFDALSLVRLTALAIEQRLFAAQSARQWVLRLQMAPQLLGSPLQGLAALDDGGQVLALNAAGLQLLQPPHDRADWTCEALLGVPVGRLRDALASGQARPQRLPGGLQIWLQADGPGTETAPRAAHLPEPAGDQAAAPMDAPRPDGSLRSAGDALIRDTLAQHRGNVAATARALGVSRGLLYRHLRRA